MGLLVVFTKVERVVNVDVLESRAHSGDKKIKSARNMVQEENEPLTAAILHRSLLIVVADAEHSVQFWVKSSNRTYVTVVVRKMASITKRTSLVGIMNMAPG